MPKTRQISNQAATRRDRLPLYAVLTNAAVRESEPPVWGSPLQCCLEKVLSDSDLFPQKFDSPILPTIPSSTAPGWHGALGHKGAEPGTELAVGTDRMLTGSSGGVGNDRNTITFAALRVVLATQPVTPSLYLANTELTIQHQRAATHRRRAEEESLERSFIAVKPDLTSRPGLPCAS